MGLPDTRGVNLAWITVTVHQGGLTSRWILKAPSTVVFKLSIYFSPYNCCVKYYLEESLLA